MRTTKYPAYHLGKLIGSQHPVGLDHFSLAVYPLRLDSVEPRTLLGQQAADDPHSLSALFDFSVVRSEPASDLPAEMCQLALSQMSTTTFLLISWSFLRLHSSNWVVMELMGLPPRSAATSDRLRAHMECVAGEGFGLGIVFGECWRRRRGLLSSEKLLREGNATRLNQHSSKKPTVQV